MLIVQYSALIAMIITWFGIVLPAVLSLSNYKVETISIVTTKNLHVEKIVSISLLIGSIFQTIFVLYLKQRLNNYFGIVEIVLYVMTTITAGIVGVLTQRKHPKLHLFFALFYFIMHPLTLLIIGFFGRDIPSIFFVSKLTVSSYFIGNLILYIKYGKSNILNEILSFVILSFWFAWMTYV